MKLKQTFNKKVISFFQYIKYSTIILNILLLLFGFLPNITRLTSITFIHVLDKKEIRSFLIACCIFFFNTCIGIAAIYLKMIQHFIQLIKLDLVFNATIISLICCCISLFSHLLIESKQTEIITLLSYASFICLYYCIIQKYKEELSFLVNFYSTTKLLMSINIIVLSFGMLIIKSQQVYNIFSWISFIIIITTNLTFIKDFNQFLVKLYIDLECSKNDTINEIIIDNSLTDNIQNENNDNNENNENEEVISLKNEVNNATISL